MISRTAVVELDISARHFGRNWRGKGSSFALSFRCGGSSFCLGTGGGPFPPKEGPPASISVLLAPISPPTPVSNLCKRHRSARDSTISNKIKIKSRGRSRQVLSCLSKLPFGESPPLFLREQFLLHLSKGGRGKGLLTCSSSYLNKEAVADAVADAAVALAVSAGARCGLPPRSLPRSFQVRTSKLLPSSAAVSLRPSLDDESCEYFGLDQWEGAFALGTRH